MIPSKNQMLKLNSNPESLRLIERLVEDVCQIYSLTEDSYGNMLIAVTEAVNNAICHGNKNNKEKLVKIGFADINHELVFSISDEGEGFNPDTLPDPTDPNNVEKINGRGVFLMSSLADTIKFEQNGTRVLLGFKY